MDPFRGYEWALRFGLPDAVVVLDAFHAVRLAQTAIDDVRRRVRQDTTGHRGRKKDPLYTGSAGSCCAAQSTSPNPPTPGSWRA